MPNVAPTINPTPYDFGSTPGGVSVGPQTFTVSNNSAITLTISVIA